MEKTKQQQEKKPSAVSDVGAWGMNVVSSVGIIMANKQLMSTTGYAFTFATTLTGLHFGVTALVGLVSNATGYSASKHVPLWELLWFSLVANTSITGMNLSLMLNSVGFYQISKLSMIPVVCVMEWMLHNKQYSKEVKMSVLVVVVGVGVCTVTDVKVNGKGFICACIAVLSTSLQQIWVLHDWNDEDCLKILSNCWKAIPNRGKVIVVDSILPETLDSTDLTHCVLHTDVIMLLESPSGKERTEKEFWALAKQSGFSDFSILCNFSNAWIMEFFK